MCFIIFTKIFFNIYISYTQKLLPFTQTQYTMKFNNTLRSSDTKTYLLTDIPFDEMILGTTDSMVNFLPGSDSTAYDQFDSIGATKPGMLKLGEDSEEELESYDVLRQITGDEEEDEKSSKLLTNDCEGRNNQIETSYTGYRVLGVNPIANKQEKCDRIKTIFRINSEECIDTLDWQPTLESAKEKTASNNIFNNIEELKESLRSAETRISRKKFDTAVLFGLGEMPVQKYTLANAWIEVDVLDFGATISAVRVRQGDTWNDVALGCDNIAEYVSSRSEGLGGTIGRVANKIEGGRFKLVNESGLETVQLSKNSDGCHVNGGFYPLHKRMWKGSVCGERLVLSVTCHEGEDGYPGNLEVWAAFSLTGDCAFDLEYTARTDTVTPVSIASGLVFNLAGHDAGPERLYDHSIFVNSEVCCDPTGEITGKLGLVYQTPYDLTDMKHLGCVMKREGRGGLDVTYALFRSKAIKKSPLEMSPKADMITAAVLRDEESGLTLTVSTDQWALRLETWGAKLQGKANASYKPNSGIRLQPTGLPNSANIDNFPNIFITPFDPYRYCVRYCFTSVKKDFIEKKVFSNTQPWLEERIFLSCDKSPEIDVEKSEEIDTLYVQTYETLEKLAEHRCGDNYEDDDSLSLHSSFTSFGSRQEELLLEGNIELEEHLDNLLEGDVSASTIADSEIDVQPEMLVKLPYPLPPYLTGKWPLKFSEDQVPKPSKKDCLDVSTDFPEPTDIKRLSKQLQDKKKNIAVVTEVPLSKNAQLAKYYPTELQIEEGAANKEIKVEAEAVGVPEQLNLNDSCSESDLKGLKNQILDQPDSPVFQWFEAPQRLPWYCGASGSTGFQGPFLPEAARRKRMGTFFKLVNFPEEYKGIECTPEEVLRTVKLKMECLKTHYNTIKKFHTVNRNETEDET